MDYDYGMRIYNARMGKVLSVDSFTKKYPFQSPFSAFNDNSILYDDPTGESGEASINKQTKTITIASVFAFYGSASSPQLAKQYAATIQKAYNDAHAKVQIDGVEYKVQFRIIGVDVSKSAEKLDGILGKRATSVLNEMLVEQAISQNKDIRVNYVRLESRTDDPDGASHTDAPSGANGANTGYWSTDQITQNKGTTVSHEYNHGLAGLDHPEEIDPNGGNTDQELSIDMPIFSYNYAKTKYRVKINGSVVLDIAKRKVLQKNIDSYFTKDVVNQLKTKGKANVGQLSNQYHAK